MEVTFLVILTVIMAVASLSPGIKIFDSAELLHVKSADSRNRV